MRLTFVILLLSLMQVSASVYSQETRLSVNLENTTLENALNQIEQQTQFVFFYNADQIQLDDRVSIKANESNIEDVLNRLFEGKNITYKIIDRRIVLYPKNGSEEPTNTTQPQSHPLKGKVTNPKGDPIPGVTIVIKGTTNGTITDFNGNYNLADAPVGTTLVFSFVGMKTREVVLNGEPTLNVIMQEQAIGLDEVVAVGYGYQKKKDLTGSIVSVRTGDMESLPVPSVSDALQGRAAGVQIISNGAPGSDATIRIRGLGTINNNNPLLVIDGVPTQDGLNQLNMNDIESVQILKDASATAIYGSRGANGVVIITTKLGKSGKGNINVDYNYGIQQATNMIKVLDASQFAALHNDMMANAGLEQNPAYANPSSLGKGTDWLGALFSPAGMHNLSVSYSGGSEKTSYYVSGNVLDQDGIVMNTNYKRYTVQFNSESKVFKNVKFGNRLTLNHDIKSKGDYNIGNTIKALPTQPIYNEDGTYAGPEGRPSWDGDIRNPIGSAKLIDNSTNGYNVRGAVYAEITLLDGLVFKTNAGLQANFWYDRTWSPKYDWKPTPQDQSYLYQASNKSITWVWDNTLTYTKTFKDVHHLTAMVGTSAQENRYDFMKGSIQNFASDLTQQLGNGTDQVTLDGNASEWSLLSYMARVNYNYADKYLVTATVRRDGSSRFGSGNKWGIFPSGSVAWRISQEKFFKNIHFIDDLKIRAGIGFTGNQEIGNYSFASKLETVKYNFNDNIVSAVVPNMMPNPNVKWESQEQINLGFDATILNQRINITADVYQKNTNDMLVPMSVPISTGYSDVDVPSINAGKMESKGAELTISSRNIDKGGFKWNTDFNISYNENKVTSLNDSIPMTTGSFNFNFAAARIAEGQPVNEFYGFVTDGIFQNQQEVDNHAVQVPGLDPYNRTSAGDIRFKDLNSDGVINDADRTYLGNPSPKFIFALNNTFSYKGFDLSVFLQGVSGNKILNVNRIWSEGMAVAYNQTTETLKRWQKEGDQTNVPRAIFNDPNKNTRPSNRWIEDGSYLRLKNVVFGYTLPDNLTRKWGMNKVRVYFSGSNLYTLTNYTGFDPEVQDSSIDGGGTVNGIDNGLYPVTKTFSFGVNMNF